MNNTKKKERRRGQSARQLMGLEEITDYSLKTAGGELVYFLVKPDNLSVLSMEGVRGRVIALENLLRGTESVRILALNSRESFERNKDWYAERIQHDQNPALCNLLRQDAQHLDDIQATMASTREFAFLFQLEKRSGEDVRSQIARMEKTLRDQGFHVQRASEQDIKRLLAIYYQQDVFPEYFDDLDGERWVTQNG